MVAQLLCRKLSDEVRARERVHGCVASATIGLELPIANGKAGGTSQGVFGVLSGQPEGYKAGYAVDGAEAIRILAAHDPNAAAWWRSHAPHVLAGGYQLVFRADVCELGADERPM
jgi:hypothetical protein